MSEDKVRRGKFAREAHEISERCRDMSGICARIRTGHVQIYRQLQLPRERQRRVKHRVVDRVALRMRRKFADAHEVIFTRASNFSERGLESRLRVHGRERRQSRWMCADTR